MINNLRACTVASPATNVYEIFEEVKVKYYMIIVMRMCEIK